MGELQNPLSSTLGGKTPVRHKYEVEDSHRNIKGILVFQDVDTAESKAPFRFGTSGYSDLMLQLQVRSESGGPELAIRGELTPEEDMAAELMPREGEEEVAIGSMPMKEADVAAESMREEDVAAESMALRDDGAAESTKGYGAAEEAVLSP